ncbi:MAG: amidohydrolase [Desulfovibrio sp.]|uniref:amidohydrolase family protein n=1 Tax=Desulfovibrio sp. TaxID=885 RepID=UPI001A79C8B9|nr:amidohydrolase family protein [Desulfovibrio sp.]MBD5418144.1 amidohydrolase [Desulfovibrio sp.]
MIIDCRVRPPMKSYVNMNLYRECVTQSWADNFCMKIPPSVVKRDPKLMFEEMDEAGIDMAVTTGRQSRIHGSIPNSEIVEIVKQYPRMIGIAGLDANWPTSRAVDEIDEFVINGPLKGVGLEPGAAEFPMHTDDPRLYPVYQYCSDHDLPVFIMAGGGQGPDLTYSMPDHIGRVCRDFPKLTVVNTHGGYPWVPQILFQAMMCPNMYIAPDMYTYNMPGAEQYAVASHGILRERFIFGTGYPFIPFKPAVELFKKMGFAEEYMDNFLYKNIARVLKLDV